MANKILITNEVIIACPSVKRFPLFAPEDQPGCELEVCPHCNNKMWVSTKKRAYRDNLPKENYYIGCYECIEDRVQKNPELFINSPMVNI